MAKITKKISQKAGLPPGSLVYVGDKGEKRFKLTAVEYNHDTYREEELTSLDSCPLLTEEHKVTWLDIKGLHHVQKSRGRHCHVTQRGQSGSGPILRTEAWELASKKTTKGAHSVR